LARFDRYLVSHLLALFGFFSLVLVAVYWVNRAVGLFDQLIGDGQTALVFLEFSALALPNVIRLVLPISCFAATVYVANRLTRDSELVVMQAAGFSPMRLVRPVVVFGLVVVAMMLVLMHFLVPASRAILAERSAEISENVTARFLVDGQFMHPADGITLYIREITETGELRDLFLADDRSLATRTTYTARRALLVRGDAGPKLVMFDGSAQTLTRDDRRLAVTRFSDFTYDIGALIAGADRSRPTAEEMTTLALFRAGAALPALTGQTPAALLTEVNGRVSQPFLALGAALIGFSTLLLGAFSRFGLWRQIVFAVLLLIVVQTVNTVATGAALRDATLWPLLYAAPVGGVGIGLGLLWLAGRPRRVPGGAQTGIVTGRVAA